MVILVTTTMIDMIVMTGTIEMINDDSKNANMAKRSIVRKLPSYGRMSRVSLLIISATRQQQQIAGGNSRCK